jgi:hypothetical protein
MESELSSLFANSHVSQLHGLRGCSLTSFLHRWRAIPNAHAIKP